ncbi:hypothetical protein SODALDRAFT_142868 [Sodiomyces alkalinus F11]|uniref:Abscission/NoCut checkpoint regulator n=1 Tax=Sodiomyces alkalinus (strain CBS 110278 / VKM F-3762 / F11) TaxID=1314773 RepID=A0A3N2PZM7_SODAK|nr:hypothetical protein SODALDRAFT_142868 [Sodiomyces alkalinus F11]ROT39979.1 hypothetical protein SODALDRAFT_142868 [Sodiomyces alkalinus F11]
MANEDKSLLDRLNALKGGDAGISLDRSSNALNLPLGIERAKPPSREDALAARLKSLRNTPDGEGSSSPRPANFDLRSASMLSQPAPSSLPSKRTGFSPSPKPTSLDQVSAHTCTLNPEDDVGEDPLLQTDDQTLEDLLRDEDVTCHAPIWGNDPTPEPGRVEALLQELSQDIPRSSPGEGVKETTTASPDTTERKHEDDDDAGSDGSDDSEGQKMSLDVDMLMSQALDQAKLEARLNPDPDGLDSAAKEKDPSSADEPPPTEQRVGVDLSLPFVPSAIKSATLHEESDDLAASLSLPSVPTTKTTTGPKSSSSANLETDLAARMAALRLPSNSPKTNTENDGDHDDESGGLGLGLPSVPTAKPTDKTVERLTTKTGYTDDDADTWCTVCLEDATLRCLGCDDDVYCTRCWREMHVGPFAAFDDRTHKAVLFNKDRKKKEPKKRVALGA